MMDLATLEAVNRRATQQAAREKRVPVLIEPADVEAYFLGAHDAIKIPYVGGRTPRGYKKLGEPLFVDKSGFGAEGEPALTLNAFLQRVSKLGASYWAVVEEGQFQCYVQRFLRLVESGAKGALVVAVLGLLALAAPASAQTYPGTYGTYGSGSGTSSTYRDRSISDGPCCAQGRKGRDSSDSSRSGVSDGLREYRDMNRGIDFSRTPSSSSTPSESKRGR